ncbi:MAG: hypothetical protein JWR11_3386 [Mycobacterium sp.]|nr:hypothetical protein [Mycobacterium sp.]
MTAVDAELAIALSYGPLYYRAVGAHLEPCERGRDVLADRWLTHTLQASDNGVCVVAPMPRSSDDESG